MAAAKARYYLDKLIEAEKENQSNSSVTREQIDAIIERTQVRHL